MCVFPLCLCCVGRAAPVSRPRLRRAAPRRVGGKKSGGGICSRPWAPSISPARPLVEGTRKGRPQPLRGAPKVRLKKRREEGKVKDGREKKEKKRRGRLDSFSFELCRGLKKNGSHRPAEEGPRTAVRIGFALFFLTFQLPKQREMRQARTVI